MQSFQKLSYVIDSSISKLGDIIKSTSNYYPTKKLYGGQNSDYVAKNYEYVKTKQHEMGGDLHSENLRECENFRQIKGKSMD
jgi:hypothetical protein